MSSFLFLLTLIISTIAFYLPIGYFAYFLSRAFIPLTLYIMLGDAGLNNSSALGLAIILSLSAYYLLACFFMLFVSKKTKKAIKHLR